VAGSVRAVWWSDDAAVRSGFVVRAERNAAPCGASHAAVAVEDGARATVGSLPRFPAGAGAVWRAVPKFWHLYMLYSVGLGYAMLFRHPILSIVTLM
jgi:hypothetical protein